MIGIYKFTNKTNGKVYIGKSTNIEYRKYRHLYNASKYEFEESHWYRALRKYGEDGFNFEILKDLSYLKDKSKEEIKSVMDYWERYYISYYKSFDREYGYNKTLGGDGVAGFSHSKTTIDRISNKLRGVKKSSDFSDKLKARKGEKRTDLTKQHMHDSAIDKIWITNGEDEHRIYPNEIDKYPDYYRGRKPGLKFTKKIVYNNPEKHSQNCKKVQTGKRLMTDGKVKPTWVMSHNIDSKISEGFYICDMKGNPK